MRDDRRAALFCAEIPEDDGSVVAGRTLGAGRTGWAGGSVQARRSLGTGGTLGSLRTDGSIGTVRSGRGSPSALRSLASASHSWTCAKLGLSSDVAL